MNNYNFKTVPSIEFGIGSVRSLYKATSSMGIQRPLIVTDAGVVDSGLLEEPLNALLHEGLEPTVFSDVVADPPTETILEAVNKALMGKCDGVIGFGGGSSMDTAKLLSVLMKQEQELGTMYGVGCVTSSRAPLIQVPTTAGTGSEVTMVAIVTTGRNTKSGVVSEVLLADKVILDPTLTASLPAHVTASTGIDAMVHAMEAYTSRHLKNPISDMLAKQALELLSSNLCLAVEEPGNVAARSNMLLGAMLAGQAFANAPVAAVHALAYPLGGNYHIPHGLSNALVLPQVIRFNSDQAAPMYLELVPHVLGIDPVDVNAKNVCDKLADFFVSLSRRCGLPTTLKAMDIPYDDLPNLANEAILQQRLLVNNPRPVERDDALEIYKRAYED